MKRVNLLKGLKTYLCFLILTLNFAVFAFANAETITTIILIDRVAELVELTEEGEVLQRHLSIPDYFSSGRSHKSSLKQSLLKLKDYGYEESFELPGSSDLDASILQSYMEDRRSNLCTHNTLDYQTLGLALVTTPLSKHHLEKRISGVSHRAAINSVREDVRRIHKVEESFTKVSYSRLEDSKIKQRDFNLIRSNIGIARAYI